MRINFDDINLNDFQVTAREHSEIGSVVLITPSFTKHKWSDEDRHLRSVLCRPDGEIISSGFPKFHNYGEVPTLDLITQEAILAGKAWFTEKMDGSLLIRSVIDGKVHFRTRGSHSMEENFSEPIMKLIAEKYPRLLNANSDARYSILFEYTSPNNLIVIPYEETGLTVLGLMDLTASPPEFVSNPELLRDLEQYYGTSAVQFHQLSGNLSGVMDQVRGWKGKEGVVVWCQLPNGKLHLSKIKASEYIRIHSLKFQLTSTRLYQFCWYRDITSLNQLKEALFQLGVDFEAVSFIQPIFEEYIKKKNETIRAVQDWIILLDTLNLREASRKDAVMKMKELSSENKMLFNVGIEYLFGAGHLQKFIDAATMGITVNQLANFRKEAIEQEEYFKGKNSVE